MQHGVRNIFTGNVVKYKSESGRLTRLLNQLSIARVSVFVTGVVFIIILANQRMLPLMLVVFFIFLALFISLVSAFNRLTYRKKHASFLVEINESEICKLDNNLEGFETGKAYLESDHPFCADLDVFGPHSLYQLLDRTTTNPGSSRLAEPTLPNSTVRKLTPMCIKRLELPWIPNAV